MKDNKFTPSDKGANLNKLPRKHNKKRPIKPTSKELDFLLSQLNVGANQARRFLKKIGLMPDAETNQLNKGGGVNLSSVAKAQINPKIEMHGYYVDCRKPHKKIINAFGEPSNQELWGIYKT